MYDSDYACEWSVNMWMQNHVRFFETLFCISLKEIYQKVSFFSSMLYNIRKYMLSQWVHVKYFADSMTYSKQIVTMKHCSCWQIKKNDHHNVVQTNTWLDNHCHHTVRYSWQIATHTVIEDIDNLKTVE